MLSSIRRTRPATFLLGPPSGDVPGVHERAPLLARASGPAADRPGAASPSRTLVQTTTPLPTKQIFVLCLMRFAEPISFSLIYPFVNHMLEDLKVTDDPKRIGYYAGIIEGLFALCTFCTVLAWGRLSDRIGRKPVLCIGLMGVALSNILFGISTSFPMMVVARCLGGALNGNVAVIKSTLGEITDDSNQGRAFSFLPLAWSLGSIIGPIIGGYLSNPATNYPAVFGHIQFFISYPYALPCLIGALFPLAGTLAGFFMLEETLPARHHPSEAFLARTSTTIPVRVPTPAQSGTSTPIPNPTSSDSEPLKPPPISDLWTPPVIRVLFVYAFLALETVALDAVLILFCYTRVSLGGLGWHEADIGKALSFAGVCTVVTQLALFPPLQRRLGTALMYKSLMALWPVVFCFFPIMSYLAHKDNANGRGSERVWPVMIMFLLIKSTANMCYGCNMLAVTSAAPSRRLLGTLNGVAQMCSSLMRAFGPIGASSLFAFSISSHVAGGWLIYFVLIGSAIVGAGVAMLLRDEAMGWREVKNVPVALEED